MCKCSPWCESYLVFKYLAIEMVIMLRKHHDFKTLWAWTFSTKLIGGNIWFSNSFSYQFHIIWDLILTLLFIRKLFDFSVPSFPNVQMYRSPLRIVGTETQYIKVLRKCLAQSCKLWLWILFGLHRDIVHLELHKFMLYYELLLRCFILK